MDGMEIDSSLKPYYESERTVLYHGDMLDILASLPPESVDMTFADPPYMLSNGGVTCQNGRLVSVDKGDWDRSQGVDQDFQWHTEWLLAVRRVLRPDGTLWVSGTSHNIYQVGHAMQSLGYKVLNDIAWLKTNAPPNLSCRYFTHSHETIIWAAKNQSSRHYFNYEAMKLRNDGKQMRSFWSFSAPGRAEKVHGRHPTQKPLALLERIIESSTDNEAVVLDPFVGSGTTAIAALKYDRRFIGVDVNREYLDLAVRRLADGCTAQLA